MNSLEMPGYHCNKVLGAPSSVQCIPSGADLPPKMLSEMGADLYYIVEFNYNVDIYNAWPPRC